MRGRPDGAARWGSVPAIGPGWAHALRRGADGRPRPTPVAVAAYAALLGACLIAASVGAGQAAAVAAVAWLLAGAAAVAAEALLELDVLRREAAHDASGAVSVAGYRLAMPVMFMLPSDRDALEGLAYVYDRARRRWVPGRGAAGGRWALEVPVRDLLRAYAAAEGLPVRAGDRMGRRLVDLGLLRQVALCQAVRWEPAYPSLADGLAAYEERHWAGRAVFRFDLGRDPRHGSGRPREHG